MFNIEISFVLKESFTQKLLWFIGWRNCQDRICCSSRRNSFLGNGRFKPRYIGYLIVILLSYFPSNARENSLTISLSLFLAGRLIYFYAVDRKCPQQIPVKIYHRHANPFFCSDDRLVARTSLFAIEIGSQTILLIISKYKHSLLLFLP